VLQPSHSHLCGYEDFSNASVLLPASPLKKKREKMLQDSTPRRPFRSFPVGRDRAAASTAGPFQQRPKGTSIRTKSPPPSNILVQFLRHLTEHFWVVSSKTCFLCVAFSIPPKLSHLFHRSKLCSKYCISPSLPD